jgi:hypothetical protein
MQKRKWKKIVFWSAGVFAGLVVVLAVHIWWVMKPHVDTGTRVMARIDLHQRVDQRDAATIQAWLYGQKGVKYVLVNPASQIAVFSYSPLENDGNRIAADFRARTPYKNSVRRLPPADAASSGCPVAATSLTYKVYAFMKRVL